MRLQALTQGLILATLAASLAACTEPMVQIQTPTSPPPAITYLPTATIQPTQPPTAVPPTLTPAPPATTAPAPSATPARITFALGATAAEVQGHVTAGGVQDFILRADADQPMTVNLSSPDQSVHLTIFGLADGQPLVRAASDASTWMGLLPATQDYVIKAVSSGPASDFLLDVEIAQRIRFSAGATSAVIDGPADAAPVTAYVLRARAGQTLTATLTSPDKSVLLTIYGFQDGEPLVRAASDATTWTGALPGTQDYIVKAVRSGAPVSYTLNITIR